MKIAVFGAGYVGVTTAVCFAEMGHTVHCIDIIEAKINRLAAGETPFFEPELNSLLQKNLNLKTLFFSIDAAEAIHESEAIFIAVGSPSDLDGSADLSLVLNAARLFAQTITNQKLLVIKSTVPVGTLAMIENEVSKILFERKIDFGFEIASNPEFLREGCAVHDCINPDRLVIGTNSEKAVVQLKEIYAPLIKKNVLLLTMDSRSAEMTKYSANSLLAAKISLMNEIARLCEKTGADIDCVRQGVGADHRIGPHALFAGAGFGGSCFPKDVRALQHIAIQNEENLHMLKAVEQTNQIQKNYFSQKIIRRLGDLSNKKIAIWGASFKPNTDDIREAPSLTIFENLIAAGADLVVFDPAAGVNIKKYFHNCTNVIVSDDQYGALVDCEALVILTEWDQFINPDFKRIEKLLINPLIFDGRNIYSVAQMKTLNFEYHSVGRQTV